jgi:cytoskeletal protein RodZ
MSDSLKILQQQRLIEIGQYLKQVRQERQTDLEELSKQTKICLQYLKAIETGDFQQLPEATHIRGLIKQYGDALKLSGQKLAMTFPLELQWAQLE